MDLPVKKRIYAVLIENENGFLTIDAIAELAYAGQISRATKKHLNGLVKRNMQHAIAMLSEDGYIIVKDLKPTENGTKLTYKGVGGYKIADKEDIDVVEINLRTKNERIQIATQLKLDYEKLALEQELLK